MISDKTKQLLKILLIVFMALIVAIVTELFIEIFAFKMRDSSYELTFWASHFSIGVALFFVSGVAFIMPLLAKTKFSDDSRDSLMLIVSILLFVSGLVAIIYSFIIGGIGF